MTFRQDQAPIQLQCEDIDAYLSGAGAFDFLDSAVGIFDLSSLRYSNPAFASFNQSTRDAHENLQRYASLLDCPGVQEWLSEALHSGQVQARCLHAYYSARIKVELTLCLRPLLGANGTLLGSLMTIGEESIAFARHHLARMQDTHRSLTERIRQLDRENINNDQLVRMLFRDAPVAMFLLNDKRQIVQINRSAAHLLGMEANQLIGRTCDMFFDCFNRYGSCPALCRDKIEGDLCDLQVHGRRLTTLRSAAVLKVGDSDMIVEAFLDMTEQKAAENRIAYLAHHDTLTGMPNRFSLENRLEQALTTSKRNAQMLAVLFLDLDRFKTINDSLGHAAGDALLIEVGNRLRECIRQSDIAARFGGDEFVIVLTSVEGAMAAAHIADEILKSLCKPYRIGNQVLRSTPSIGIAIYPNDGDDVGTLMKNADNAMYHAKAEGRNNIQFFTDALNQDAIERLHQEEELRLAIQDNQFELHYQPKVDKTGACTGFEALVRWLHPREGLYYPDRFIPLAEECGLIQPLGDWVLEEACRQLRAWRDGGLKDITVAVNLSADQLRSQEFSAKVDRVLSKYGVPSSQIEFEVTESVAMRDPEKSIRQLMVLRSLGIKLSIDDFGTGYSSLSYLKLLPIQSLKLDRTFVRDIEVDLNDVAICSATIALAHNLGLTVIAEGVETAVQHDFLTGQGCDCFQGYLFSKPLSAAEAFAFAVNWRNPSMS